MLYVLHDPDSYRMHERLAEIRAAYRHTNPQALGETVIEEGAASLEQFRAALAQGGGLFEAKGLVIGRDLFAQHKEALSEMLQESSAAQREDVNVVLVETLPLPASAKPLITVAKAEVFDTLSGEALLQWIVRYVRERGPNEGPKKIGSRAADQLLSIGSDLWRTSRELEKLLAYAAGEEAIREEHVRALLRVPFDETVFPVSDGICERSPHKALAAVTRLLDHGDAIKETRQLIRAHAARGEELPEDPLKLFGAKPFVWRKRTAQARKWSDEEIAELMNRTVDLEATWKGSGDTRLALDKFILAAGK